MTALLLSYDESGNTGGDLLESGQPVYVVASTSLDDDQAQELLEQSGLAGGTEAHFKKLRRRQTGQKRILDLLERLPEGSAQASVIDKRFMTVAKIVDDLVETAFHRDGVNLYAGGGHVSLTNLMYFTLPVFHPEEFESLLDRFVALRRRRSPQDIERFFATCRRIRKASDEGVISAVFRAIESLRDEVAEIVDLDAYPLDPCLTAFLALTSSWTATGPTDRTVTVHYDATPVMQAQQDLLAQLCDQTRAPRLIGAGERAYTLPLPVDEIRFVPSDEHAAVQVADLVASSIAFWVRARRQGEQLNGFQEALREHTTPLVVHTLMPNKEAISTPDETFGDGCDPASDAAEWLNSAHP